MRNFNALIQRLLCVYMCVCVLLSTLGFYYVMQGREINFSRPQIYHHLNEGQGLSNLSNPFQLKHFLSEH